MEKRAYSVTEAASSLGLSRSTVWNLMDRGELAYFHVGSRRLISASELDRFVAAAQQV